MNRGSSPCLPAIRGAGRIFFSLAFALPLAPHSLFGQSSPAPETTAPPPIQDNSFLMEEAYNQEEGVVQHINAFQRMRGGGWIQTFTQEWPVPRQAHQLSFTVPYQRVSGETGTHSGLGDLAVNYRYQLAGSGETKFACTPRLTVLLPTGDEERGLGTGGVGFQVVIAASTVLSSRIVTHTNVGATYTGSARNERGEKASLTTANAGQSFIWTVSPTFNAMLETVWLQSESVTGPGRAKRENSFFVSPGIRWAYNAAGGLQIVPGIAFPVGVGANRHEGSVLLYLSFEHPMWRARGRP